MSKLITISNRREGEPDYYFYCAGCKCSHGIWTQKWVKDHDVEGNPINGPVWTFNGDIDKPTFSPSILVTTSHGKESSDICHSFVRDGMIQYLGDCTHELKGQTIELSEV